MEDLTTMYAIGDIVVHRYYGVGQIDDIEFMPFNGVEVECFKVKTENGNYWFPIDSLENPRVHPVASQELIQKAIKIFQSPASGLDSDLDQWKERIGDVQSNGDFLAISTLVRDLTALKSQKGLNQTQGKALNGLKDRLLNEWAASVNVDANSIRSKLNAYLK